MHLHLTRPLPSRIPEVFLRTVTVRQSNIGTDLVIYHLEDLWQVVGRHWEHEPWYVEHRTAPEIRGKLLTVQRGGHQDHLVHSHIKKSLTKTGSL